METKMAYPIFKHATDLFDAVCFPSETNWFSSVKRILMLRGMDSDSNLNPFVAQISCNRSNKNACMHLNGRES